MTTDWLTLFGELTALAAGVAFSPFAVVPAIALVVHSVRPRPVGLAFIAGWLLGKAVPAPTIRVNQVEVRALPRAAAMPSGARADR